MKYCSFPTHSPPWHLSPFVLSQLLKYSIPENCCHFRWSKQEITQHNIKLQRGRLVTRTKSVLCRVPFTAVLAVSHSQAHEHEKKRKLNKHVQVRERQPSGCLSSSVMSFKLCTLARSTFAFGVSKRTIIWPAVRGWRGGGGLQLWLHHRCSQM